MSQKDIQVLFYVTEEEKLGYLSFHNIPISTTEVTSPENFFPDDKEKEAIYQKWPQAKGRLRMLYQGVVFNLD